MKHLNIEKIHNSRLNTLLENKIKNTEGIFC
jgi:hypothetical protein